MFDTAPIHFDKADSDQDKANQRQCQENNEGGGQDFCAVDLIIVVAHSLPPFSSVLSAACPFSSVPCFFMIFTAMKQRVLLCF
jgi:hypothetical protein